MSSNMPAAERRMYLALALELEGLSLKAYQDVGGVWTIGYGHTSDENPVEPGDTITQERADELFFMDIDEARRAVKRFVKVPLTKNQRIALEFFVFNIGVEAFRTSTLIKKLNAWDYDAVPAQLRRWNKDRVDGELVVVPGLVRRRAAEVVLWSTEDDTDEPNLERSPPIACQPTSSVRESPTGWLGGVVAAIGTLASALQDLPPLATKGMMVAIVAIGAVILVRHFVYDRQGDE